jgi:hypothetical protein
VQKVRRRDDQLERIAAAPKIHVPPNEDGGDNTDSSLRPLSGELTKNERWLRLRNHQSSDQSVIGEPPPDAANAGNTG